MWVVRALAITLFSSLVTTAHATTLLHRNIEALTDENELVVQGEVLKTQSYWSNGFILTDVALRLSQVLKGTLQEGDLRFTLIGGRVGETTALVIDGAEL